jgi:hypothetical protein
MPFSAAATASSDFLTGRSPTIQATDTSVICQRFPINLAAADLANGVCGAVGILPAGHVPVAFELDAAQLDSGGSPTLAYSVGVLNAAQTALSTAAADGGAAWATGQTTGRTAGGSASGIVASRPMKTVQQAQVDRNVGIILTAAAATAAPGQLALTVWYRPA